MLVPLEFDPAVHTGNFDVDLPEPGDRPCFFAFGVHKSASTLLDRLFHRLCNAAQVPNVSLPQQLFRGGLQGDRLGACTNLDDVVRDGYCFRGFRMFPGALANHPLLPLRPKVLLVRDPRDALVSEYFSMALGQHADAGPGPARAEQEQYRRHHGEQTLAEFVLERAVDRAGRLRDYRTQLGHLDHLRVFRYEDVVFDKLRWVREMLDFVDMEVDEPAIQKTLRKLDVQPTSERAADHIRWVVPGDHIRKLDAATIGHLDELLAEELDAFDYPRHGRAPAAPGALRSKPSRTPSPLVLIDPRGVTARTCSKLRQWNAIVRGIAASAATEEIAVLDRDDRDGPTEGLIHIVGHEAGFCSVAQESQSVSAICVSNGVRAFASASPLIAANTRSVLLVNELVTAGGSTQRQRSQELAIRHASGFVCTSDSAAHHLLTGHPAIPASAVAVAGPLVDRRISRPRSEEDVALVRANFGIDDQFVLFVGNSEDETSGFAVVLEALDQWQGPSPQLVVVGPPAELERDIAALLEPDRYVHLLEVDAPTLAALFSGAAAVVRPRHTVGVDLLLAEAMACGSPVIASTSQREFVGAAGAVVDPASSTDLRAAMATLLVKSTRNRCRDAAFRQAVAFERSDLPRLLSDALLRAAQLPPPSPELTGRWRSYLEIAAQLTC